MNTSDLIKYKTEKILKRLEEEGFNTNKLQVSFDQSIGEGHGYLDGEEVYHELESNIEIQDTAKNISYSLWLDVAKTKKMDKPEYFIVGLRNHKGKRMKFTSPEEKLKELFKQSEIDEIYEQPYFRDRNHMAIFELD